MRGPKLVRVYSSPFLPSAHHARNVLEAEGISVTVRNEATGGAVGEIPPIEGWVEVWVSRDDETRAKAVVEAEILNDDEPQPAAPCPRCGAPAEVGFEACWSCGASFR